jgi:hypothetical protein
MNLLRFSVGTEFALISQQLAIPAGPRSNTMDAETYSNVVLPVRSKARKAYDQAIRVKAPKALLAALLKAKNAAETWADESNPYAEPEPTDDSDSDADTGTRVEVEVKAKPPVVRVNRIEAR